MSDGLRRLLGVIGIVVVVGVVHEVKAEPLAFTPESVAKVTQEKCIAHADQSLEKAQATLFADNQKTFTPKQSNLIRMLTFSACMKQDYTYGYDLMRDLMQQELDKELSKEN